MTFHEMINIVLVYSKAIIKITIITSVLAFLFFLFIYPVTYNAPVTVLPPTDQDNMSDLRSLVGGSDFSSFFSGGIIQGNSQLYVEIIKSRSAAEYVVKKYHLVEYYGSDNIYDACIKLRKDLITEISKENIITLSVSVSTGFVPMIFSDKDSIKQFAANLSNSYIEALDKINREKISYKAKRAREYIERQLEITHTKLDSAEYNLMRFKEENKTISLPEQLQAAIDNAAELKAEIIKTQIEIGLLEPNLRNDNQTLISLRKKLSELKKEYGKFEIGTEDYVIAFNNVPKISMQFANLLREVKIQNEIYILLQQQYYQEKIQENKDLPTIEVLDTAIPPLKASAPRLFYSTILVGIFTFLLISLYFILRDKKLLIFKNRNSK